MADLILEYDSLGEPAAVDQACYGGLYGVDRLGKGAGEEIRFGDIDDLPARDGVG